VSRKIALDPKSKWKDRSKGKKNVAGVILKHRVADSLHESFAEDNEVSEQKEAKE